MAANTLTVIYILPSRYDDDGYLHRYWRGVLPSNTLCVLRRLTEDVARASPLGETVQIRVETIDEAVQRLPLTRIIRRHRHGERIVVGLAGVQSNQFPRAADIANVLRDAGVPVLIGGFHVSGVLAVFDTPSAEIQALIDRGVSIVRGEVESPGALSVILSDACAGTLRPIYSFDTPPDLSSAPVPVPDPEYMRHFVFQNMGTIDTSRGCPFNCSFCTIINVQGRTMRHRSAEAMLKTIEQNHARGVNVYFFTDDNLSRSPVAPALFDGLIALRARGKPIRFMMQVDTQAWKLPSFLEKAAAAGCYLVFVGMESVNPDNLAAAGKRQNKVGEFAEMVEAWHRAGVLVHVGYIIGFPHDTEESVRRDLAILKDGVKVDEATFFMLTPLPGSRDHKVLVERKTPIDADLNNFDSFHETYRHPRIAPTRWQALYREAWESFYNREHIVNVLLRTAKQRYWQVFWLLLWNRYATLLGSHTMVTGLVRMKSRKDRRPTFPRESGWAFIKRRYRDYRKLASIFVRLFFEFQEVWLLTRRKDEDPRWTTLATLRDRWAQVRNRVDEYDLAGKRDAACEELRAMLESARTQLIHLAESGRFLRRRIRKQLLKKAEEAGRYLRTLEMSKPTWQQIVQAERFIGDSLVSGYENLAIRYVAHRRQFNAYRQEVWTRLKTGRILTLNVSPIPRLLLFELALGLRFGTAFLTRT